MRGSVSAGFFFSASDAMTKTDIANLALIKIGESLIDSIDDTGDKRARLAKLLYEPALREILRAHFWDFAMAVTDMVQAWPKVMTMWEGISQVKLAYVGTYNSAPSWSDTGAVYAPGAAAGRFVYLNGSNWTFLQVDPPVIAIGPKSADRPDDPTAAGWSGVGPVADESDPTILGFGRAFVIPADFLKLRHVLDSEGGRVEQFQRRRICGQQCLLAAGHETLMLDYVQFVDDPNAYDPLFVTAFSTLLAARLARAITGSEKAEADLLAAYLNVDLPAARTADGHDTQSAENHPLREFLDGTLTPGRGDFFPND